MKIQLMELGFEGKGTRVAQIDLPFCINVPKDSSKPELGLEQGMLQVHRELALVKFVAFEATLVKTTCQVQGRGIGREPVALDLKGGVEHQGQRIDSQPMLRLQCYGAEMQVHIAQMAETVAEPILKSGHPALKTDGLAGVIDGEIELQITVVGVAQ